MSLLEICVLIIEIKLVVLSGCTAYFLVKLNRKINETNIVIMSVCNWITQHGTRMKETVLREDQENDPLNEPFE
jgi:hypothetical protein